MTQFRGNGKFLITGEYLVLLGAEALAMPLRLGQSMTVEKLPTNNGIIHWDAFTPKGLWFSTMLNKHDFTVRASDDLDAAKKLSEIFQVIKSLNSFILNEKCDYSFTTRLDFDRQWGLGSSSTLVSNLAQWADVNPYDVLKETFGGSGYDVACATCSQPIIYKLENDVPKVRKVDFSPTFAENLYFVYLDKKQISSREVNVFKEKTKTYNFENEISEVSEMTYKILTVNTLKEFQDVIGAHEGIISKCIGKTPLKTFFNDFDGAVKSLGAWGGDFFLAASEMPFERVSEYFQTKGLKTVFKFNDLKINNI